MRNLFVLTRFLLRCGLGSTQGKGKKKRSISGNSKITYLILVVCMIPMIGMMYEVGFEGYKMLQPMGMETVILQVASILGATVVLFLGIAVVISVFFLSSDIEGLLPMPLSSWQIVGAKFIVTLLYEYLWVFFFIVPVLIGYGISAGLGITYWLTVALGALMLPVVPLVYASVLAMLIMRIFRKVRNKDVLSMIGFGLTMILAMFIGVGSQMMGEIAYGSNKEQFANLEHITETVGVVFPNFRFLSDALMNESMVSMLLFWVTSIAFVVVFLLIANKIYFKSVVGMSESSDKQVKMTRDQVAKVNRPRSPLYSYLRMELRRLFRTPIYFFNCALMPIIFPLFMFIPMIISMFSGGFTFGMLFGSSDMMGAIRRTLQEPVAFGIVLLVVAGMAFILASVNMTTATSISREGKGYIYMKYIPMSYKKQLQAKVLSGAAVSFISAATYTLLIEIFLVIFGMNVFVIPLSLIVVAAATLLTNYIQLLFDVGSPKLVWENETAAVKQNFHAALGMFAGIGIDAVFLGILILLYIYVHVSIMILVVVGTIILVGITILVRQLTYAYGEKKIIHLEE